MRNEDPIMQACPQIAEVLGHPFDHYDPKFALDPHDEYSKLRAECPVGHTDAYGGFFLISRYDDINTVLHNPEVFSSYPADTPPPPSHTRPLPPFEVDPPDHVHYRRIVDPLFGPKRMKALEPELRRAAQELLDAISTKSTFDFVAEFAAPFPSSAFLSLIGLDADRERRDQLCKWVEKILHATVGEEGEAEERTAVRVGAAKALREFLAGVIDEKKNTPGTIFDDLVSSRFAGERHLTPTEVLDFSFLLVLAGVDTVTSALGFAFWRLGSRPDLQARLAEDGGLIPSAVEEVLRFESAVNPSRTVKSEFTLGGVTLRPGDRVLLPYASADRDETVFNRADEILLERTPNRHFAFGSGSHRCLGSHLARLEMKIAFEEIFERFPRFSIPQEPPVRAYGGQTRSLISLPFAPTPVAVPTA